MTRAKRASQKDSQRTLVGKIFAEAEEIFLRDQAWNAKLASHTARNRGSAAAAKDARTPNGRNTKLREPSAS